MAKKHILKQNMKVQLIFKWFDFWIGIFYDQKKNWVYLLPIPMFGIIFKLPDNWRISSVVESFKKDKPLTQCQCGRDGECWHPKCPVTMEDAKNGKYCQLPLYDWRE